jgi:DNA-binding Lrp family transcriptional regulator
LKNSQHFARYAGQLFKWNEKTCEMDDTDQRLLSALRHDARASLSDLALTLGVSRTTVRARIERLQRSGEIVGFSVVVKDDTMRDPVRGLMMLGIEGRGADRIIRQLNGLSAVRAVHSTNGRWDLIVEIGAPTLEALDEVLARIRRFDGVSTSETSLLLSTKKSAA